MKFLHIITALLFIAIAVVQLNDPDPFYWVIAYLAVAFVSGARFLGKRPAIFSKITIGMILAGLLMSAPGLMDYFTAEDPASIYGPMTGKKPYIESTREFGGLFIAFLYLLVSELSTRSEHKT